MRRMGSIAYAGDIPPSRIRLHSVRESRHWMKASGIDKIAGEDEKFTPPESAQNAAKKVLQWKEEHGDDVKAMTPVGWARARQLARGDALSYDVVKRMAQFKRHQKNSRIAPEHRNEPWKDRGYCAWLGWGAEGGINWAIDVVNRIEKKRQSSIVDNLIFASMAILSARGQQTRRKDKDLMQDTGGISKGRDREPDNKPPRDDLKDRYRDRRLVPEKIDKDTNEDKDRDVKKPSRRPQVKKSSVEWTAELVMDCCDGKFGAQCEFPGDLKNGQVIIRRNRGNPPLICYYGEGGAGYIWSTAEEIASELNAHGIPLPSRPQLARIARIAECVAIHPLDRKDKNQWLGMDVSEDNYCGR
jgi:hypothetical protein